MLSRVLKALDVYLAWEDCACLGVKAGGAVRLPISERGQGRMPEAFTSVHILLPMLYAQRSFMYTAFQPGPPRTLGGKSFLRKCRPPKIHMYPLYSQATWENLAGGRSYIGQPAAK